jgi:hypothetical protein
LDGPVGTGAVTGGWSGNCPIGKDPIGKGPAGAGPVPGDPVIGDPVELATTTLRADDVDGLKTAASVGVKVAVIWCDPRGNAEVVPAATPLLTANGPPRLVVPSLNCTAPTAVAGETVAVSVSVVPGVTGEAGEVVSAVLVAVEPREEAAEPLG